MKRSGTQVPVATQTPTKRRRHDDEDQPNEGLDSLSKSKRPARSTSNASRNSVNAQTATDSTTKSAGNVKGVSSTSRKNRYRNSTRAYRMAEQAGQYSDEDELQAHDSQDDDLDSESVAEDVANDVGHISPWPAKRGRGRPRGKQKAARAKRTPTPPSDMPPYEQYFFQNRPGGLKTSNNTLSSMSLLTHEDFYDAMRKFSDHHQDEMDYLYHLHSRSFDQWYFELEEGFSLCLFGWGSKRLLLSAFADHIASASDAKTRPMIIIVNGFNPTLTVRDILSTVAGTISSLKGAKLGAQPADMLSTILTALDTADSPLPIHLLIHSMDASPLRRPATQSILARLAQHPHVRLAFTADTTNFPLLWDARLRSQFNVLFHDATTFHRFAVEISVGNGGGGVVDEVNLLLGRSGRRVHGREGVVFVLRSLTESARRLFGLLVSEVLSLDTDDAAAGVHLNHPEATGVDEDDDQFEQAISGQKSVQAPTQGELGGVGYRVLYRKAVQQLITGNEISFRQLLKEFYDHQMVVSRRDGMGTEVLSVPFRREECEAILEDLVVDD